MTALPSKARALAPAPPPKRTSASAECLAKGLPHDRRSDLAQIQENIMFPRQSPASVPHPCRPPSALRTQAPAKTASLQGEGHSIATVIGT